METHKELLSSYKPWLPYLAIEYLENILTSNSQVFEWGCGGSTLFFAQRCQDIISVEHNEEWFKKSSESLTYHNLSYLMFLIPPEPREEIHEDCANPNDYKSFCMSGNFRKYASKIDEFDNFDLVFVDGRARASCIKHAIHRVKVGGWIVVDNTEREYYLLHHNLLDNALPDNFESIKFFGHGPKNSWPWETTFLKRLR